MGNAGRLKPGSTLGEVLAYFRHHIIVLGFVLHGARVVAQHMHYHQASIAPLGNLNHSRIAEARYIIDDACARFNRRLCHLGMAGIDAYAYILFGQLLHYLDSARKLFFDRHGICTRAR